LQYCNQNNNNAMKKELEGIKLKTDAPDENLKGINLRRPFRGPKKPLKYCSFLERQKNRRIRKS